MDRMERRIEGRRRGEEEGFERMQEMKKDWKREMDWFYCQFYDTLGLTPQLHQCTQVN
jgi:hypothetical protein